MVLNEETKEILFVECKWKTLNEKTAVKIFATLKDKSGFMKWNNDMRKEHFGLIAKKVEGKDGLRKKGFVVFDLDDIGFVS